MTKQTKKNNQDERLFQSMPLRGPLFLFAINKIRREFLIKLPDVTAFFSNQLSRKVVTFSESPVFPKGEEWIRFPEDLPIALSKKLC